MTDSLAPALRLLLLSNSSNFGRGYLDHAIDEVADFLAGVRTLVFVPFALRDRAAYTATAAARLAALGIAVEGLREDGHDQVAAADAVFVGGGNTFRLLATLQRTGLLEAIGGQARGGMRYMGASAGTNLAAPTIRTTNDMPIVEPPRGFGALGLVPFQINPHYLDADPASRHMGETRETRLREYLEDNAVPVVGLREGSWLRVDGGEARLGGATPARVFRRDRDPEELAPGSRWRTL